MGLWTGWGSLSQDMSGVGVAPGFGLGFGLLHGSHPLSISGFWRHVLLIENVIRV